MNYDINIFCKENKNNGWIKDYDVICRTRRSILI